MAIDIINDVIVARLSNTALLSAENFNKQALSVVGASMPISAANITDSGDDFVEIKNMAVSGYYSVIYIESAKIGFLGFDPADVLYLSLEDEPGTSPRENIETFNKDLPDIAVSGSSSIPVRVNGGPVDSFNPRLAPNMVKFSKLPGGTLGGVRITRVIDMSRYSGIYVDLKAPSSSGLSSFKVIIKEFGTGAYLEFDFPVTEGRFESYYLDFDNPSAIIGLPNYQATEYIEILGETDLPGDSSLELNLANIYGMLSNTNNGLVDNRIKIVVTDNPDAGIVLATRTAGEWIPSEAMDIPALSDNEFSHISNNSMHIPKESAGAFEAANVSSENALITYDDLEEVRMDSKSLSRAVLLSMIKASINHSRSNSTINSSLTMIVDSVTRGLSGLSTVGSEGYINTEAGTTTSIKKNGYYSSTSSPTEIHTLNVVDTPFDTSTIMVDVAMSPKHLYSSITYDFILYDFDTNVHHVAVPDGVLGEEYDLKQFYLDNAMKGTVAYIKFKIPADSDLEGFSAIDNPFGDVTMFSAKIATDGNGYMSCCFGDDTYLSRGGGWMTSVKPPENFTSVHSQPGSTSAGMRLFSRSLGRGYIYDSKTEAWATSESIGSSFGKTVSDNNGMHLMLSPDGFYRINDITGIQDTLLDVFAGETDIALASLEDGTVIASNNNSCSKYDAMTNTWTVIATPTDTVSGPFSMMGSGNGSIYRVGGSAFVYEKYDPESNIWTNISPPSSDITNPVIGLNHRGLVEVYSSKVEDSSFVISTPDNIRFYGFGVKLGYGRITGDADHIGCWKSDIFPDFIYCDDEEAFEGGFWTDDAGRMFGAEGPWWGYFANWAEETTQDHDLETFDSRLENGFWSDDDGIMYNTIDGEGNEVPVIGPNWDGVCWGLVRSRVWTDAVIDNSATMNSIEAGDNGFWCGEDNMIPVTNGEIKGAEWSE